ncbi:MAG: hypothetical protein RSD95_03710 [Clostridia bacterium]
MPQKVEIDAILKTTRDWLSLKDYDRDKYSISYDSFKEIMLGSNLLVTDISIRLKFKQLSVSEYASKSKTNPKVIVLNVYKINRLLDFDHLYTETNVHIYTDEKQAEK